MLELLDFPRYLSEHGNKVEDIFLICVLNRQVNIPEHLKDLAKDNSNIFSLVDIVGVDIKGKKFLVKGQAVVLLGRGAYRPVEIGKRVLVLKGTAFLRDSGTNYIEILQLYSSKGRDSLYATSMVYKEVSLIRNAYPNFMKKIDKLAQSNWDMESVFEDCTIPFDYRVCCSGCVFEEVQKSEQFTFQSDSEYRRANVYGPNYGNQDKKVDSKPVIRGKNKELESRKNILKLPTSFDELDRLILKADTNVAQEIEKLGQFSNLFYFEDDVEFFYNSIKNNWRRAPSRESATGRALLRNVLEFLFPNYKSKYDKGVPFLETALDVNNILDIWHSGDLPTHLKDDAFYFEVSTLGEKLYIGAIDYLLSLRGHFYNAYVSGSSLDIDLYSVIKKNPYYLSLIDSRLSIEDLDKLGMLYNVNLKDPEVIKFRNAAYVHHFMLDTNNPVVEENTIIRRNEILNNIFSGLVINSKAYKNLIAENSIISEKVYQNLVNYISSDTDIRNFMLPTTGWKERKVKNLSKYTFPLFKELTSDRVLKDYLDTGLGIEYEVDNTLYIIDYTYALKEKYIIQRLYDLQMNGDKPFLDSNKIEQCIRAFERRKALEWDMPDFRLEEKQADAVRLLYNPVLCVTGSAGSGKTTTAEAILFALQALLGVEEDSIMFCAPTGKAANRLKEIVKKPTRTIHSLFGIGGESYTILDVEKVKKKSEIKVLIVDEGSMINLELMYNMITKISDNTRIIFLGDRSQLPPIGPGKPFTNLLTFLPCVVLTVPKRASENSGITRNAEELLHNSDVDYPDDLIPYDDFKLIESPKEKIVDLVKGIVNYHLGGAGERRTDAFAARRVLQSLGVDLEPDDIQVVTPVNKFEWGTRVLNPVLQDVFNLRQNYTVPAIRYLKGYDFVENEQGIMERVDNYIEYRVNDRVIHLENMAMADRFVCKGKNIFSKVYTTSGVMNGDVGKIHSFVLGSDLHFVDAMGADDESVQNMFSDNSDILYMAVKYQDVDADGLPLEYIIFYKCDVIHSYENDILKRDKNIYTVDSTDLRHLDLAYALTVHKLQGSQAKLIIFILYNVGRGSFISRNMIYTGMTRAEQGIYIVGNVTGWGNAISRGRKIEQNILRDTIADKIFEDDVK